MTAGLRRETVPDTSAGMLAQARVKPWPPSVRFVHAPVGGLAAAGVRGPFDAILAGKLLGGDAALYRYLRRRVAGFDGWQRGIVHTFLASRPAGDQR